MKWDKLGVHVGKPNSDTGWGMKSIQAIRLKLERQIRRLAGRKVAAWKLSCDTGGGERESSLSSGVP